MKNKDGLTDVQIHELTGKNQNYEPEDEVKEADKIAGLGHSKKEHMNSGIYAGVENRVQNNKVLDGIQDL